jgi:PilZ domain
LKASDSRVAQPPDRRAFVRYATDADVTCRTPRPLDNAGWMAKLLNISCTGLGLLMQHRFQPGSPLDVELQSSSGVCRRGLRVRVIHASAVRSDGHASWLIGCAMAQPISEEELRALL